MPSDAHHAVPPRPSVFISYASADRAAARALRDTLEASGLDVWFDEEELGGGEVWDLKIRNQIRTCTYFMPIISATTEVRREGYFRREWRLAVERTLDFADDVVFLVPIVIDGTRDVGARVPEKFFSVQWLRVPGGEATPQLKDLARKLAAIDSVAHLPAQVAVPSPSLPPPLLAAAPAATPVLKAEKGGKPPPPFPHIPPFPEPGHRLRFCYDLIPWSGRMVQALWMRLPKWARAMGAVIIAFNLIDSVTHLNSTPKSETKEHAAAAKIAKAAIAAAIQAQSAEGKPASLDFIKTLVDASTAVEQAGRPLAIVNFGANDKEARKSADHLFGDLLSLLRKTDEEDVSISAAPLPADFKDDDALGRGTGLESDFVLTGVLQHPASGSPQIFTAKLYGVKKRALVWTETYDLGQVDAAEAARRVADAVRQRALPGSKQ